MTMDSRDYRFGIPVGFPGRISRRENLSTEPRRIDPDAAPEAYGLAVGVSAAGDIIELADSAAAADIYGFIAAPEFSTHTPAPEGGTMGDVMRQGYMTVKVASGTPSANSPVYARIGNASEGHPLGEVNAAPVTETDLQTVAVPGARFVGPSSASGDGTVIAEIAFNL